MRVNGTLVLSRSIGDAHLKRFLSQTPHVIAMTKDEVKERCQKRGDTEVDVVSIDVLGGNTTDDEQMPCFIVLASDGLWDVISNQEAVDMVELVIQNHDPKKKKRVETAGGSGGGDGNDDSWQEEEGIAFQEAAEMLTKEAYARGST